MATNNILSFCAGANPNVTPLATWQTKAVRSSGFVSGIAISGDVNAAIVGGANIAHAVGEFIKNQLDEDVNPTNEAELVSQFLRALQIFIQRGGACPIGSIIPYLGGDVPYGWLLANGASVLRSQYNKLFALIGTKFGAVDEAHFNLPNLHHRFIEGTTSLSEVGSYVEAGLPNISFLAGTFLMGSKVWAEGISINYQQQINFSSGEVSGNFVDYRLNSTAINSVYGASDTNQPEAVRVLSLVKAY
jgi:hypothetical protein|nr:MAG TPA: tail collar domain [Caudoviricetes sp.]